MFIQPADLQYKPLQI